MKQEETNTKTALLAAFDKSEKKTVSDLCRIVGIARFTYYYHLNKDAKFKTELLKKQREHINGKIEAAAV
jgi:hypothetical protein